MSRPIARPRDPRLAALTRSALAAAGVDLASYRARSGVTFRTLRDRGLAATTIVRALTGTGGFHSLVVVADALGLDVEIGFRARDTDTPPATDPT